MLVSERIGQFFVDAGSGRDRLTARATADRASPAAGDFGLDLYSNGLMVSKKLLASNPKAVAGLVRATNKAMIAIAKDQNAGMKAAVGYDNLINEDVEKRRLQYSFEKLIISPEMKEIGIGDIKDDRMTRAIAMVAEGYQLDRVPTSAEVFSREFLPPRAERELVYTAK